jgi:hypothetical protein
MPRLVVDNEAEEAKIIEDMFKARFAPLHACFDRIETALAKMLEPSNERVVSLDDRRKQEDEIYAAYFELFSFLKSDRTVLALLTNKNSELIESELTEMLDHWNDEKYWEDKESGNA